MEKKKLLLPEFLETWTQAGLDLAAAMEKAQKAVKALSSTSGKVKRMLAGFDQIKRLEDKKKTPSSGKKKKEPTAETDKIEEQTQKMLAYKQLLEQVKGMLVDSLVGVPGLTTAITAAQQVGQKLFGLWQNQLIPVGQWLGQSLIPLVGQGLTESFQRAASVAAGFGTRFSQLWQVVKTEAGQSKQTIGQSLLGIGEDFDKLVLKIFGGSRQIGGAVGDMQGAFGSMEGFWSTFTGNVQTGADRLAAGAVSALQTVIGYVQGGFLTGWQTGFSGLTTSTREAVNGVVGCMNKVLSGLGTTVNSVVETVNKLKIKLPDWLPGIGGKQLSFSLKTVATPQIPYLAQGAVLPANQPFLAMVGDQKHGTNVEAPLATIQEAVAAVMADHTAGNMAGHEATVAVLNRILEAVLGIDVGEAVIARAAQSYRMKENVMKGGGF